MGIVNLTPKGFSLGQMSDLPRSELPQGAAYRLLNWIPQNDATLLRRGRWIPRSADKSGDTGTPTYLPGVVWAPFDTDHSLIFLTDNGRAYRENSFTVSDGTILSGGTGMTVSEHPPFWHRASAYGRGGLVIFPTARGSSNVVQKAYYIAAYAVGNLGGTPPIAAGGFSYGDYLVLFNGIVGINYFPNRMWWSAVGNPESWPTSTSFWDFPEEIYAAAPIGGLIMAFGPSGTHLLVGDQPPPGGNFSMKRYFFEQGILDPQALVRHKDTLIWANASGVWRSDGSIITSITDEVGESRRWRDRIKGYGSNAHVSLGVYQDKLIASITTNNSNSFFTYVFDLDQRICYEFDNLGIRSMAFAPVSADGLDELFLGSRQYPQMLGTASMFGATNNINDPDGVYITAILETPFYKLGNSGEKRWRRLWVSYGLYGPAGGSNLDIIKGTDEASPDYYDSSVTRKLYGQGGLTANISKRLPVRVDTKSRGVQFRIRLNNVANGVYDARIFGLEADATVLDPSRDGDLHD